MHEPIERSLPNRARGRSFSAVALLALAGLVPGHEASAQEPVLLRPNGDVLAVGSSVEVRDTVSGDVMTAGGTIAFDGVAAGSYVGAGGQLDLRGRVDGSVRAAGGTITLGATVGRNVTLAGGNVEVASGATIERNAYMAGGQLRLNGAVRGDMYMGGGEVTVNGSVGGDLRIESGRLTLGPEARIGGELRYRAQEEVSIHPSATVGGGIEVLPPREERGAGVRILFTVLRLLAFLVSGVVLVALFPGAFVTMSTRIQQSPVAAIGLGLLGIVAIPVAAAVAMVTVVGLPLGVIVAGLYGAALYLAPVVPAFWIGARLVPRSPGATEAPEGGGVRSFLVGGLILGLAILLPWIGWIVRIVAVAFGFGAAARTLPALGARPAADASAA